MDPITIGFWIGVAVVVIALLTPQGRSGLWSFVNWLGSLVGLGAKKLETPATDREQLGTEVDLETQRGLADAEKSYARAKTVLEGRDALLKDRAANEANVNEALRQAYELTHDNVPDEEQKATINKVSAIGQTAAGKIRDIDATMTANAENYAWAEDIMRQSEQLFSQLPELAAQKLREGDVNAAAQELAAAQTLAAHGMSAFSDSAAAKTLAKMKKKTAEMKAGAEAAQKRAMAAPASADVAASMLRQTGKSMTSDFDKMLADYTAEKNG